MLLLKYLLLSAGIAMFVIAAGILSYDAYLLIAWQRRRLNFDPEKGTPAPGLSPILRWRIPVALVMLAWAPLLISAGIVIVPRGMAGVRVSQTCGTTVPTRGTFAGLSCQVSGRPCELSVEAFPET